jgi:hypothetical protein
LTYKENRGWLIERGIVAFHWSNSQGCHWSILLKKAGKMECPMGNSQKFPSRPRGVSKETMRGKPGEKNGAENDLPYTSRYVTSYEVISGDATSDHFR